MARVQAEVAISKQATMSHLIYIPTETHNVDPHTLTCYKKYVHQFSGFLKLVCEIIFNSMILTSKADDTFIAINSVIIITHKSMYRHMNKGNLVCCSHVHSLTPGGDKNIKPLKRSRRNLMQ